MYTTEIQSACILKTNSGKSKLGKSEQNNVNNKIKQIHLNVLMLVYKDKHENKHSAHLLYNCKKKKKLSNFSSILYLLFSTETISTVCPYPRVQLEQDVMLHYSTFYIFTDYITTEA